MQRIIKPLLHKYISCPSLKSPKHLIINPSKNLCKYLSTDSMRELNANNYFSKISMLEHCLDDAVVHKHNNDRDRDLFLCREALDELLQELKKAQPTKISRISQLEAEVKAYEKEFHTRETSEIVLGFALQIHRAMNGYCFNGKYDSREDKFAEWRSIFFRFKRCNFSDLCYSFKKSFMHILMGKDEILLLRWMDLQVLMLHEDAKDLDNYYNEGFPMYMLMSTPGTPQSPRKFLPISTFTSNFDKLLEQKQKLTKQSQILKEEDEDDDSKNIVHDELIFNTIVKIAEAREKMCLGFSAKKENSKNKKHLDCVPQAINEASKMLEDLLVKLPVNYDMTLRQWLEFKLQAKLHGFILETRDPAEQA